MSKNPDQNTAEPKPGLTLSVTLVPSLTTKELIDFHQRATASGESPEERLARLIRQDADKAA